MAASRAPTPIPTRMADSSRSHVAIRMGPVAPRPALPPSRIIHVPTADSSRRRIPIRTRTAAARQIATKMCARRTIIRRAPTLPAPRIPQIIRRRSQSLNHRTKNPTIITITRAAHTKFSYSRGDGPGQPGPFFFARGIWITAHSRCRYCGGVGGADAGAVGLAAAAPAGGAAAAGAAGGCSIARYARPKADCCVPAATTTACAV